MSVQSLYVLYCGSAIADKGMTFTYRVDVGVKVRTPFLAFLIKTDDGYVLCDSGIDPDDIPNMLRLGKELDVKKEDFLLTHLQSLGISQHDIRFVFQSHLHWDHTGLLRYFTNAQVIIQREEYNFALTAPAFTDAYYRRKYYDSTSIKWRIIDGDEELMSGLTAILTPGHSPGHQSLLVELPESKSIILVGDCAYISENIKKEIIPGVFINPVQALQSLKKLKMLSKITNGKLFYSHDIQELQTMKRSPEFYK